MAFKDLGSVSVMLGNGAGNFGLGTVFPTVIQGHPSEIAAADLNGDGASDLVAGNTNSISNAIAVLLGQGLVPFGTGTSSCAGILGTSGATAARIGQSRFGFTVTNAPPNATGALMVAAAPDVLGTQPRRIAGSGHDRAAVRRVRRGKFWPRRTSEGSVVSRLGWLAAHRSLELPRIAGPVAAGLMPG